MEQLITPDQAKVLKASLESLRAALKKRDELIVLNNAAAAKNHAHAVRVMQARSREIDAQADAAVAKVQSILVQQGLGGLHGAIPISAIAITVTVAAAIGLMALAAIFYTNYQIQREERLYATENPVLAFTRQASTGVWAVLGLGAIGLGGLIYWDYRTKGAPRRPAYGGGLIGGGRQDRRMYGAQYPFDERTTRDYDMSRRVAEAERQRKRVVPPTLVQYRGEPRRGGPTQLGYADIDKTDVDDLMAEKVAADWLAERVSKKDLAKTKKIRRNKRGRS